MGFKLRFIHFCQKIGFYFKKNVENVPFYENMHSKFEKSASMTQYFFVVKIVTGYKKTQNFMMILTSLNGLLKNVLNMRQKRKEKVQNPKNTKLAYFFSLTFSRNISANLESALNSAVLIILMRKNFSPSYLQFLQILSASLHMPKNGTFSDILQKVKLIDLSIQ
jgi:hypothetical protein